MARTQYKQQSRPQKISQESRGQISHNFFEHIEKFQVQRYFPSLFGLQDSYSANLSCIFNFTFVVSVAFLIHYNWVVKSGELRNNFRILWNLSI